MIAGKGGKAEGGHARDDGKISFLAFPAGFPSPLPRPSRSRKHQGSLCKALAKRSRK